MDRLIQVIDLVRSKLSTLRRHSLKETPTRTIIIDPILEALGWDVRDPDEVELEYPTVDGKSVDYALKLNGKPVLLIEAKALEDPLNDLKAVTQVVAYASNDGVVWCVLTNGVHWKVYRSVETCPAPDKLMFAVNLDPKASEGMTVKQLAEQMWRLSAEEMRKGTLDTLGEQTFTDGTVRKALMLIMSDPPRTLVRLIREAAGDEGLSPQRIKDSLTRIATESATIEQFPVRARSLKAGLPSPGKATDQVRATKRTMPTRRAKKDESPYDESHHVAGKPREAIELYKSIDRLCLGLDPGAVRKRYLAKCINYESGKRSFCSVHILQGGLRVWVRLKYSRIENPPDFARDVSNVGHWGAGDLELGINNRSQLDIAAGLIRLSFDSQK
jgi:predicted transport protein